MNRSMSFSQEKPVQSVHPACSNTLDSLQNILRRLSSQAKLREKCCILDGEIRGENNKLMK